VCLFAAGGLPITGNNTLHVPVVQAFAAEGTWSQMGLAGNIGSIGLKRKATRDIDPHAGVGILNQVVATQRRKESHNATEQKRRQRINEKMKELQLLLPGSDPNADKASILNTAIDHIKRLQQDADQLTAKKHQLERQNQELQEENEQMTRGAAPPKKQIQDSALPV
jgi:FtsZ-binding cell division protein ZapB